MEGEKKKEKPSSSSLRWGILRDAFLSRSPSQQQDDNNTSKICISRKTAGGGGFNLIPFRRATPGEGEEDVYISYILPLESSPTLVLRQRVENAISLNDYQLSNKYNVDSTGLVCHWPSEDVLAYFCFSHADLFRSKRILELGAGYGLAGLVIAASTDASEVVISDGNPQVVDYIQHNIDANSKAFAETIVKPMMLHWNQEDLSAISNTYDIIIASDCTFFKEFHECLARTVKTLLKRSEDSEAIFVCPKRGNSLDKFIEKVREAHLKFSITENYDEKIWRLHQHFLDGDGSWPNYEMEHCYPLLIRITL